MPLLGDDATADSIQLAVKVLADFIQYLQQKAGALDAPGTWTQAQTMQALLTLTAGMTISGGTLNALVTAVTDLTASGNVVLPATTAIAKPAWTLLSTVAGGLTSSWVSPSPNASDQGAAAYLKTAEGIIMFKGAVSGGADNSKLCTMPAGSRPGQTTQTALVSSNNFGGGQCVIFTNGEIYLRGLNTTTSGYVSLGGMFYFAEN